jgi:hypothetical protein
VIRRSSRSTCSDLIFGWEPGARVHATFLVAGRFIRTPAPTPLSGMNSTPLRSSAERIDAIAAPQSRSGGRLSSFSDPPLSGDLALDHGFGARRHEQVTGPASHEFDRLTDKGTGEFDLVPAVGRFATVARCTAGSAATTHAIGAALPLSVQVLTLRNPWRPGASLTSQT